MRELGTGWGFAANTFIRGEAGEMKEMLGLGAAAEQGGFDSVWVGDHVLWHTPIVDGMTLLSAYTGTTERIDLGTAILLLGIRQKVTSLKPVTSLNALSGDRLILGVGVGGENPAEFEACDVPIKQRGKRLDEALGLLEKQWSDDPDTLRLEPTGDRIPVMIGGRSDAARRRVIRYGDAWLHAFVSPKRVAEEMQRLNDETDRRPVSALHVYVRTGAEDTRADSAASEFLSYVYNMEGSPLMRYTVSGTPERCAEQLNAYVEAGVEYFVLRPAAWEQREQLEEWAESLLPLLPPLSRVSSAAGGG